MSTPESPGPRKMVQAALEKAACRCDFIKGFVTGKWSCIQAQHNDKVSYRKEGGEVVSERKDTRTEVEVHRRPCLTSDSEDGGRDLCESRDTRNLEKVERAGNGSPEGIQLC